jgi:hypothetical protein
MTIQPPDDYTKIDRFDFLNPQGFLANTFPKPFLIGYKLLKEGLGQSKAF